MATKKKAAARRMKAMKVGAGVAAGIAGALAGAYLLYERSKPQQKHAKVWVMKARKAAAIEAKQLSSIGESEYRRIVEKAMRHYGAMNKIGAAEVMAAVRDAKSEWKHIKMQAKKAAKPAAKAARRKKQRRERPPAGNKRNCLCAKTALWAVFVFVRKKQAEVSFPEMSFLAKEMPSLAGPEFTVPTETGISLRNSIVRKTRKPELLVSQCFDRALFRRLACGIDAEHHAACRRNDNGDHDRRKRERECPADGETCEMTSQVSVTNMAPTAMPITPPKNVSMTDSMRNCWRMSLVGRAHGLAEADLAGPFNDRHEHDVHDADAADDERDGCDRGEEEREDRRDVAEERKHVLPASRS